ncbi:MAG: hypothetical protein WA183_01125, partial [Chthoniobacterales bacterium]
MKTSSGEKLDAVTQFLPSTLRKASRILFFPALLGPIKAQICGTSKVRSSLERKFCIESRVIRMVSASFIPLLGELGLLEPKLMLSQFFDFPLGIDAG